MVASAVSSTADGLPTLVAQPGWRRGREERVRLRNGREYIEGYALWLCQCHCGEPNCKDQVAGRGKRMRAGDQVSCGALRGNAEIRRAARLKTPAKRRRAISMMGVRAKSEKHRMKARPTK